MPYDANTPNRRPEPEGSARLTEALHRRKAMIALAFENGFRSVASNGEEDIYDETQVTSFTKGLPHNAFGLVARDDYLAFVEALNTPLLAFDLPMGAPQPGFGTRKWESPLAGHFYSTQGPDADGVAMSPAPKLGRSELCAEMAILYAMALLRDVPFTTLVDPAGVTGLNFPVGHPRAGQAIVMQDIVDELNALSWFNGAVETTYAAGAGDANATPVELARRRSHWADGEQRLTVGSLFRGSTRGAKQGPYISQFMLLGSDGRGNGDRPEDGRLRFGTNTIDQRVNHTQAGVDYMQSWTHWLQVQQGDDVGGGPDPRRRNAFTGETRFILNPRDLGDYVHFDQLYQAYFNACLILLNQGAPLEPGFPTTQGNGVREATSVGFAQFGGPHILSLMTEVATRGLKAVRRQKFQIHRRGRPELIAARLTLAANDPGNAVGLEATAAANLASMLSELGSSVLLQLVAERNRTVASVEQPISHDGVTVTIAPERNYLLPMAFPEGSPMHAAYGAGHATVAGACVTMLKAFFDDSAPYIGAVNLGATLVPNADGSALTPSDAASALPAGATVGDELDKLAANVSIGRNMAGVHFHSDYFDSLRMGERVAVGMLHEQMLNYPEPVAMSLRSFDGDTIRLETTGGKDESAVSVTITDTDGAPVSFENWWWRHV